MNASTFSLIPVFFFSLSVFGQYTDQINSNRPGASIGAFSVGTRVIQFEAGAEYRTTNTRPITIQKSTGILVFSHCVMDF